MRVVLLVAALLAASLASGCISSSGRALTLRDGLADAEHAAHAWADGKTLQLVGAAAVEPFKHLDETQDGRHTEIVTHLDPVPGDGKAPGWIYGFLAGDRCIGIVLAAGLGVLAEGYQTCDPKDAETLPAWSIDSDEAAALLAARTEWPKPTDGTLYTWELSARHGQPVWSITAEDSGHSHAVARVNAANGTILFLTKDLEMASTVSVERPATPAAPEAHGTQSSGDSRSLVQPGGSFGSSVRLDGPGTLAVRASFQQAVGAVTLRVQGPTGTVESVEVPAAGLEKSYAGLPAGDYTVTVTADAVALLASESVTGVW
jgi:hypothetical protein